MRFKNISTFQKRKFSLKHVENASIKMVEIFNEPEIGALLKNLFASEQPNYLPNLKFVFIKLSINNLIKLLLKSLKSLFSND